MIPNVYLTQQGPRLSRLVAGTMWWGEWGHDLSPEQVADLIDHCLELGITSFDHADIYGHYSTEALFGEALKLRPGIRDKIQLISKCGIKLTTPRRPGNKIKSYDHSMGYILESVETSLRNLNTDHLDLLLVHRPGPLMHPDELSETFHQLQREGKVKHFGVSNFTPSQYQMLGSRFPLVTNQVEASLLHLTPFFDGTFDLSLQHNQIPMAWSPLGGGDIFKNPDTDQHRRIVKTATEIAQRHGNYSLDQVLLAFLLRHPSRIAPVLGTANKERLSSAVGSFELKLNAEEWYELLEAARGEEVA